MTLDQLRIAKAIMAGYLPFRAHPSKKDEPSENAPEALFANFTAYSDAEPLDESPFRLRFVLLSTVLEIDSMDLLSSVASGYSTCIRTRYGKVYSCEPKLTLLGRAHATSEWTSAAPILPLPFPLLESDVPERHICVTIAQPKGDDLDRVSRYIEEIVAGTHLSHTSYGSVDSPESLIVGQFGFAPSVRQLRMDKEDVLDSLAKAKTDLKRMASTPNQYRTAIIQTFHIVAIFEAPIADAPCRSVIRLDGNPAFMLGCLEGVGEIAERIINADPVNR